MRPNSLTHTHTHIYRGLYLQDLTFIEMQPKLLEDGIAINFTQRWKQFKSVDHIRFAQTKYVCSTELIRAKVVISII